MDYTHAKEKRRLRKIYLDKKKSKTYFSTSVPDNSSTVHVLNRKQNGDSINLVFFFIKLLLISRLLYQRITYQSLKTIYKSFYISSNI